MAQTSRKAKTEWKGEILGSGVTFTFLGNLAQVMVSSTSGSQLLRALKCQPGFCGQESEIKQKTHL